MELRTKFLPAWVLANMVGWIAFCFIFVVPYWGIWLIVSISLLLGLAQWLILQKFASVDWSWAVASIPAYGGAFYYVYFLSHDHFMLIISIVFTAILAGGGIFQWLVLRQYVEKDNLWLTFSPAAGFVSFWIAQIISNMIPGRSPSLFWILFGMIYGILTGVGLVHLMGLPSRRRFS
jgi:hypothetical protein